MKTTALVALYSFAAVDLTRAEQWLKIVLLLVPVVVGAVQALRRPPRRESKPRRKPIVRPSVLPLAFGTVACFCLMGCAKDRVSSIVQALGSDTNAVSVRVVSPWGQVDVRRNAPMP